jgi:hypothetical protein
LGNSIGTYFTMLKKLSTAYQFLKKIHVILGPSPLILPNFPLLTNKKVKNVNRLVLRFDLWTK